MEEAGYKINFHCNENGATLCTLFKSKDNVEIAIKGIAELADEDVYIKKLGRYLALSRAAEKATEFDDVIEGDD